MAQHNTREGKFRTNMGGTFLSAAIAAYLLSPLIAKSNPVLLAIGGIALAIGWDSLYERSVMQNRTRRHYYKTLISLVAGMILLVLTLGYTGWEDTVRQWNRCARLENAMLNGRGKTPDPNDGRSAPHDAFTALGCRPSLASAS